MRTLGQKQPVHRLGSDQKRQKCLTLALPLGSWFCLKLASWSPVGEQTGCGIRWPLMAQVLVLQGKFLHRTAGPGGETASPSEEVHSLAGASEDHLLAEQTWKDEAQEASSAGLRGIWEEAVGTNPMSSIVEGQREQLSL